MKTFAPDSVAVPTSLGVTISVNSSETSAERKPRMEALATCQAARCLGWRSVTAAWSRRVGSPAPKVGSPELRRRWQGRLGERREDRLDKLRATRRRRVVHHAPGHLDDCLLGEGTEARDDLGVLRDDLRQARAVPHHDERHAGEQAASVDPTGEGRSCAFGMGCEVSRKDAGPGAYGWGS